MSSPAAAAPPLPTAEGLLGGLLVTSFIMFTLYGITVAQSYIYLLNSKDDPLWMRIMVGVVWILETLHSIFAIRWLYYMFITGFGNFEIVGKIHWSVGLVIILENCIVVIVEGFFIRRLWILSHGSWIMLVVTIPLLIARIGLVACHTTAVGYALTSGTWVQFQAARLPNITVEVSNALSASIDGIIALSLIYYLYRGRSGVSRTDSIVRWLMSYAVNSGAMMMIVSLAIAITYVQVKDSLVFMGLVTIVSKLYANALLGTLNARTMLRSKTMTLSGGNLNSSAAPHTFELSRLQAASGHAHPGPIQIFQEKTQVTDAHSSSDGNDDIEKGRSPQFTL
ncbi:hypothetical protein K474DRAFT_493998 [Panus rudis PR-1116 ss-1]|nr:hypothetical protein K474DRAFT_493998 [Panus rudis PR-1116 ss-1]